MNIVTLRLTYFVYVTLFAVLSETFLAINSYVDRVNRTTANGKINPYSRLTLKVINSVYLDIAIRNGKIVWKVVWIEYYFRLGLSSRMY